MKKLRILSMLLVAVMLGSVACTRKATQSDKTQQTELKVVSYNVRMSMAADADGNNRWENRKEASIKMVNEQNPLVMGLQEACPDQIEYLDSNLNVYKHIGVGRDDGKLLGEMMAIYYDTTRVELLKSGTFWLSETPDSVSFGWDAACRRTCTWGVFALNGTDKHFSYFNTHLDHMGQEARKNSITLIVSKIKELAPADAPVFLTADFNSYTDNPIFNPLKAAMSDARKACEDTDTAATYNGFGKIEGNPATNNLNDVVIDHIFFKGVTPVKFEVLDGDYGVPYISDHYPIVFTFRFND